jgi:hypothetical protein
MRGRRNYQRIRRRESRSFRRGQNCSHLWSIFIDGYWRETCTDFSEDGTNRSVVIEAKRLVDSEP